MRAGSLTIHIFLYDHVFILAKNGLRGTRANFWLMEKLQ
jgi:hypothetical protein